MGSGDSKEGGAETEMTDVENPAVGVAAKNEDGAANDAPKLDGDFERKQRDVNEELKNAKECIVKVKMAEGKAGKKKSADDDDEGGEAKREFNRALKSANVMLKELDGIRRLDEATHRQIMQGAESGKTIPSAYLITDEVINDRKKLIPMVKEQIGKVKITMKQKNTKRERPTQAVYIPPAAIELTEEEKAEEKAKMEASQGVEADALADLPDLAPESAAAYKEFVERQEKAQAKQQKILEMLQTQEEKQHAIADESKVQDELCAAQGEALETAIEAGQAANDAADKFLEEHGEDSSSKGKMICYAIMILIILGGGYYVYTNKDKLTGTDSSSNTTVSVDNTTATRRADHPNQDYERAVVDLYYVLKMLWHHISSNA